MEPLNDMRNRAEQARLARDRIDDALDDAERSAASIIAAFVSERSSYDVPVLLKTVDEVLRVLAVWEKLYNGTGIEDAIVLSMSQSVRAVMKRAMNEN